MTQLTARALEDFASAGIDVGDIAESRWGMREWHGDECGCTDDRCVGFHHDGPHCGCRPVVIQEHLDETAANAAASELWARHASAHVDGLATVRQDIAAWVNRYHRIATSWSLDVVVEGRRGITITSPYNDLPHLVWAAPTA